MRFLIIEYPGVTPIARFTRDRPGATVDLISEPATGPPGDRVHPCIMLIRGVPWRELDGLLDTFGRLFGKLETLQRDPRSERWLGRVRIREADLHDTLTLRILRFQERFGAPWAHVEGGAVHLRARIKDPAHGEALAADIQQELARLKLEELGQGFQVEVRELGPRDYGVWDELVQHAIGLA